MRPNGSSARSSMRRGHLGVPPGRGIQLSAEQRLRRLAGAIGQRHAIRRLARAVADRRADLACRVACALREPARLLRRDGAAFACTTFARIARAQPPPWRRVRGGRFEPRSNRSYWRCPESRQSSPRSGSWRRCFRSRFLCPAQLGRARRRSRSSRRRSARSWRLAAPFARPGRGVAGDRLGLLAKAADFDLSVADRVAQAVHRAVEVLGGGGKPPPRAGRTCGWSDRPAPKMRSIGRDRSYPPATVISPLKPVAALEVAPVSSAKSTFSLKSPSVTPLIAGAKSVASLRAWAMSTIAKASPSRRAPPTSGATRTSRIGLSSDRSTAVRPLGFSRAARRAWLRSTPRNRAPPPRRQRRRAATAAAQTRSSPPECVPAGLTASEAAAAFSSAPRAARRTCAPP